MIVLARPRIASCLRRLFDSGEIGDTVAAKAFGRHGRTVAIDVCQNLRFKLSLILFSFWRLLEGPAIVRRVDEKILPRRLHNDRNASTQNIALVHSSKTGHGSLVRSQPMSVFGRLLVPGCTELPVCRCGKEMDIASIERLPRRMLLAQTRRRTEFLQ